MRMAVLGTGVVGQTLAEAFDGLGHDVVVGTRDPEETRQRTEPGQLGGPGMGPWLEDHPGVGLATFAEAAAGAEVVVNATSGGASVDVLALAGEDNLADKVIIDVSNGLDFSASFPPSLTVCNTDSIGEQLQRAHPRAKVVKTLNTMNATVMVAPGALPGESTVFVSGDDPEAKESVSALLRDLGHRDVVDLGDISTARGPEMFLALWTRLLGPMGTAAFNIHVVR